MKRFIIFAVALLTFGIIWGQSTLINDNIQTWTNRGTYGNYTQEIAVGTGTGTVNMTSCMVSNGAAATGTGSIGRVQMQASTGILQLPQLPSVGRVEFHLAAGSTGRTVALQSFNGSTWDAITSFTGITTTGATYTYDVNFSSPTTLRLASPSHALYVHDIIIGDYSGGTPSLAVLSTVVASSITSTSAISGGNISSDGGAVVTSRGVVWNTSANPTIDNYFSTDGNGTGSFVSNIEGLTASTVYYYRAYATNSQGTAYGEEYSFSTSGNSPPAAPVASAATNVGINSFTANWNASSGATSYRLDVSTSSSFTSMLTGYNNLTVNSTSQSVSGLSASTTYYYRVRAYNSYGTSSNSGNISVSTLANDPYSGYYNPVVGLSGTTLKNALHDLIDNNTYANYDGAKLFLFQTLDNNDGVVRCVYTGQDYTISSSYNGSSTPNTEHTYAQSWFGTSEASIKKADVHHLFITNANVNSSRSNYPFDVVSNVSNTYTYANGYVSKKGTNSAGRTVFEPADQHKGNLARALLYFHVRYNMTLSQGGVDMLETLINWHNEDPVDSAELTRNTLVLGHQGNRNPFVDHPEYVSYIWGGSTANTTIQFSPASAVVNESDGSVTLSVQIANPSSTVATTAQIAISDGLASDVGNFTTRSISFPADSSTNQTISVNITDDSLLEGTEVLIFSLINVSGGNSATIGNYGSFSLEIIDNDIPTPVATSATNTSFTGFTANWNAAADITDYYFDLSTASNFSSFVGEYQDYPLSATSIAIGDLEEGSTYYYRVRAVYNESAGSYSNVITAQTNAIVTLDPPIVSEASAVSHEGFTARWEAVSGADNYRIDVFSGNSGSTADLIISEYVEGSSNNKYIEIYNGTGSDVDLSNYQLRLYSNGASTPSSTTTLSGTIASGTCMVYKNSSAVLTLPEGVTAITATAINFNGDDAFALWKIEPAGYVDIFGSIGQDPGTAWGTSPITTVDKTLRRKSTVLTGISDDDTTGFPSLSTEWDSYPTDTADGLGSHSFSRASTPVPAYQDLLVYGTAVRVSDLEPETTYSYRVRAQNSGYTSSNSSSIEAVTTAIIDGTGANTAISGIETTVLIPELNTFSNNNVTIDPGTSSSDDFSIVVSAITGGIRYTVTSSNANAYNADYVLNHAGLGYAPASVLYRINSVESSISAFSATTDATTLSLNGISGSGSLEIDLLQAAQELDAPIVSIEVIDGDIVLSWTAINGATSYRIEASDNPFTGFSTAATTSQLTWSEAASSAKRFYKVTALN
jgi:hypothetical protein